MTEIFSNLPKYSLIFHNAILRKITKQSYDFKNFIKLKKFLLEGLCLKKH